jgi:hypothetical protein
MGSALFVIWDQRTAGSRRFIFFEMRHAAAPAFKRTYIGQSAETLRPSNQSHVLSAAWAQRQLRPRASRMHDEARFSAIHAQLHWQRRPMARSTTTMSGHRSPAAYRHGWPVHGRTACCVSQIFHCFIARMQSIRQSVQNGQFLCRLAQNASNLLVALHTDKRRAWIVFSWLTHDTSSSLHTLSGLLGWQLRRGGWQSD